METPFILVIPYYPSTNDQVERYNSITDVKRAALYKDKRTNWDEQLPFIIFNYNRSINSTSDIVP